MKNIFFALGIIVSTLSYSQTKNLSVDFNTSIGTGKKMTGVNTGPHSIVSGTTEECLQYIGTELVRTHDYHGACDYWNYTNFFNYFNQTFNYSFKSHIESGYNWANTDNQINEIVNANLQPFFRVGISFPGGGVSPATPMPKDSAASTFYTFAGIAKRTAMHYTNGWNNGFYHTIPYWEIWNEPNNGASWTVDSVQAYYRLYKECADSIKSFNPQLKVGGPGLAKNALYSGGIHFTINSNYVSNFLSYCQTNNVPLDFYSFHMYDKTNPYHIKILTDTLAYFLNQYGFNNTELIISETNINTGGYDNTAKGCSFLASELISTVGTRLNKFIWYRGVDLSPLCNSDNGNAPNLTLNGYAYKFFNDLNDSTPVLLSSIGSEFDSNSIIDSLNNLMVLAGKNSANTMVKILVSNHESIYSQLSVGVGNLPFTSSNPISITIEKVRSNGYETATTSALGADSMNINLPAVDDASVFLITLKDETTTNTNELSKSQEPVFYPNPAKTKIYINSDLKNLKIKLTNLQGQIVAEQNNAKEIEISKITNGCYFISLENENGVVNKNKIIIAN